MARNELLIRLIKAPHAPHERLATHTSSLLSRLHAQHTMPARPQQIIASPPRAAHVAIGGPQSTPVIQQLAAQLACNPFPTIRSIRSPNPLTAIRFTPTELTPAPSMSSQQSKIAIGSAKSASLQPQSAQRPQR